MNDDDETKPKQYCFIVCDQISFPKLYPLVCLHLDIYAISVSEVPEPPHHLFFSPLPFFLLESRKYINRLQRLPSHHGDVGQSSVAQFSRLA